MFEALYNFLQTVVILYIVAEIVLNILALVISHWVTKKIAKRYFKKHWEGLSHEECKNKSRCIWYVGLIVALLMLVLVIVAHYVGFGDYPSFYVIFMPVWIISRVNESSCEYMEERFPEDCSKNS